MPSRSISIEPSFTLLSLLSPEVSNGPQINSNGRYGRDDYRIDGIDELELVFSELSVVFMDTTTFRGHGGDTLGQKRHSKDYRPHLKQMVIGIIIDQNGQTGVLGDVAGNTADFQLAHASRMGGSVTEVVMGAEAL